jgi:hypothetical protein
VTHFVGRRVRSPGRRAIALSVIAHGIVGSIAAAAIVAKPAAATKPVAEEPIEVVVLVDSPAPPDRPAASTNSPALREPTSRVAIEAPKTHAAVPRRVPRAPLDTAPTHDQPPPSIAGTQAIAAASASVVPPAAGEVAPTGDGARGLPSARAEVDRLAERGAIALPSSPPPAHTKADDPLAMEQSRPTFTMHVDSDGTAHISDRRNLQRVRGHDFDLLAETSRAEQWLDAHHEQSNVVDMKVPPVGVPIVTFDVTDWAMRSVGQDPYAFQKLKLLDATREQRAEIGARHRERQVVQTPALVRESLVQITALPPEERHAALLDLWRSCDTTKAGAVARATISSYVRTQPAFSADDRAITEHEPE